MSQTDEITVAEAAELTGYSERHIRRWAKDESIEARQVGGWLYLIDRESLLQHVGEMKALGNSKHAPGG